MRAFLSSQGVEFTDYSRTLVQLGIRPNTLLHLWVDVPSPNAAAEVMRGGSTKKSTNNSPVPAKSGRITLKLYLSTPPHGNLLNRVAYVSLDPKEPLGPTLGVIKKRNMHLKLDKQAPRTLFVWRKFSVLDQMPSLRTGLATPFRSSLGIWLSVLSLTNNLLWPSRLCVFLVVGFGVLKWQLFR